MSEEGTRNLKLTVAYDGTAYHGFQDQNREDVPTIQQALERAWHTLTGEKVRLTGAGRTDAGVHALGQVVNFRTHQQAVPTDRVPFAMNSVLPEDIRVVDAVEAPYSFHARFDAVKKRYVYRIDNRPIPSPLERLYTHFEPRPLDAHAMNQAAGFWLGRHDFTALSSAKGSVVKDARRTVVRCEVEREGDSVIFRVEADGFLYHMVRAMAGTLVMVGLGRQPPSWAREVLNNRDRSARGPTLPAKGLTLYRVWYEGVLSGDEQPSGD